MEFLQSWTQNGKHVQPEVANKIKEWFGVRTNPDGTTSEGLGDWDISRDAPYFGIEIPDAPGKYFYVWLDAPVGYLASLKNLLDKRGESLRRLHGRPRRWSSTTSSARTSSPSTPCSGPRCCTSAAARRPTRVCVHGFLTVNNGEKMSKSRGTGLDPLKYLSLRMNPEWLRYYLARQAQRQATKTSTSTAEDFMLRVNSDLIGKYVNIASRAAGFIAKRFDGKLGAGL